MAHHKVTVPEAAVGVESKRQSIIGACLYVPVSANPGLGLFLEHRGTKEKNQKDGP